MKGWNVSHLSPDTQSGILFILNRDYGHILEDIDEKSDTDYPIVINEDGDLAWKEDKYVMSLMTSGILQIDFTALALDPTRQSFRKQTYKRMGYTLQKYNALWHESNLSQIKSSAF